MKISIVYDSGYGHTKKLAEAVASGVQQVAGAQATLVALADGTPDWAALAASDAIIFGSPTYNGTISARFKQFMEDSTRQAWSPQLWRNKVAAGFTNSGAMHGDKLNSLITMALFAAQHGMLWAGLDLFPGKTNDDLNRVGGWLGVMAQSDDAPADVTPIASDLNTAAHLGQRVAQLARQLAGGLQASSTVV
jgi:NAD(P)H dehydrogenase (quinone)